MKKMNLQLLDLSEMNDFTLKFINICAPEKFSNAILKGLSERVREYHEKFSAGFNRDKSDPFTHQIEKADIQRDRSFNGFRYYINSFTHSADDEKLVAATKIKQLIFKHGMGASRMSYTDETTAITGLIKEILSEYSAEIELLNANTWIDDLRVAQETFDELVINRINNGATDIPSTSQYKNVLVKALKQMIASLESHVIITEDPALVSILNNVYELVNNTMSIAHAKATRKQNQKAASDHNEETAD